MLSVLMTTVSAVLTVSTGISAFEATGGSFLGHALLMG